MGKTANYNLPFPEATDKANVPLDIQKLAEAAEAALGNKVNSETGKRLITDEEANKLAALENYDDSELIKLIDSQNIDIKYLEKQVERLLKDYRPIPFNSSSNHLVDTGELPILDLGINGGIEQDTRVGYNLLQVKEAYWGLTDKGITNLAQNAGYLLGYPINLKANTTYYLNFVLLSRPTSATTFVNLLDDVQNDNLTFLNIEQENHFTIGKVVTKTYTPTKDEVLTTMMWGNANKDTFEFQYWVTSDSTKTTYEQYGSMPSLAFPSEVKGVSGDIEVKIQNKNLADMEVGGYSQTTGAKEYNPNLYRTKDFIKITNLEYIMTQENSQKIMRVRVFLYDDEKNLISSEVFDNNIEIKNTNAKYFTIQGTLETFNYTLDGIQLEQGDVATDYVPHQEQLLPIDIPTGQTWYSGKPYKENGKWYRDVEYEERIYNGTENWLMASDNNFYLEKEFESVYAIPSRNYCNMLKFGQNLDYLRASAENGFSYQNMGDGNIRLWVNAKTLGFTTVEEWKEYLASNNLKIVKYITTSIKKEITDTTLISQLEALQKAHSYYEVTNINSYGSEDVADLVLSGNALMSNDIRLSKLENAILSIGGNV